MHFFGVVSLLSCITIDVDSIIFIIVSQLCKGTLTVPWCLRLVK